MRQQPDDLVWRQIKERADLVELSIVSRAEAKEPLVEHFILCASPNP